jgi:hypothetical protein
VSLLGRIFKGALRVAGFVSDAGEFVEAGHKLVTAARRGELPLIDDTDPIPLSHSPRQPPPVRRVK